VPELWGERASSSLRAGKLASVASSGLFTSTKLFSRRRSATRCFATEILRSTDNLRSTAIFSMLASVSSLALSYGPVARPPAPQASRSAVRMAHDLEVRA